MGPCSPASNSAIPCCLPAAACPRLGLPGRHQFSPMSSFKLLPDLKRITPSFQPPNSASWAASYGQNSLLHPCTLLAACQPAVLQQNGISLPSRVGWQPCKTWFALICTENHGWLQGPAAGGSRHLLFAPVSHPCQPASTPGMGAQPCNAVCWPSCGQLASNKSRLAPGSINKRFV